MRDLGEAQRQLLLAVLGSILAWGVLYGFVEAVAQIVFESPKLETSPTVASAFRFLVLVPVPFQVYCFYKLLIALEIAPFRKAFYIVGVFIPPLTLLCVLDINQKATTLLRAHGIRVGLMGARPADLPSVAG